MKNQKSLASLLMFIGSTLCFFFPFVTVSCGGVKAFTLTGQQLATGTTLREPQPFGPPQTQKIDPDLFAAVTGLCAIGGVGLSLIGRRLAGATAATGGVGAVSLLVMRFRLDDQLQKQAGGMASATYETGFTVAVLLLIAGAVWNAYLFRQNPRSEDLVPASKVEANPIDTPSSSTQSQSATGEGILDSQSCSHCGQRVGPAARFCEACGTPSQQSIGANEVNTSS